MKNCENDARLGSKIDQKRGIVYAAQIEAVPSFKALEKKVKRGANLTYVSLGVRFTSPLQRHFSAPENASLGQCSTKPNASLDLYRYNGL